MAGLVPSHRVRSLAQQQPAMKAGNHETEPLLNPGRFRKHIRRVTPQGATSSAILGDWWTQPVLRPALSWGLRLGLARHGEP
jgi:hypothetical protein